jgi:DNA primase
MRYRQTDPDKQRPTLLEYLEQHGCNKWRRAGREEIAGLCPLHRETKPSFFVNRRKGLFYCHGCGRGGDVIRLMQLLEGLSFRQARARLIWNENATPPLREAIRFYQSQLTQWPQALGYLDQRGIYSNEVIERMRIGYAPGACLRRHLESLGYSQAGIAASGLLNERGWDRFYRCLTFPVDGDSNLYGRAIDGVRHQFLPRPKGGLYGWERGAAWAAPSVIVVEGLFDVASLWQAGFDNAVAALGANLNQRQMKQLCDGQPRLVYLCLDADENGSGPAAAHRQRMHLLQAGLTVVCVELPPGHDPNSYFTSGHKASDFNECLERACQSQ